MSTGTEQIAAEAAAPDDMAAETARLMNALGVPASAYADGNMKCVSPITGKRIGDVPATSAEQADAIIGRAHDAFREWRIVPAPRRGELVRLFAEELRAHKTELGRLVSIEVGKIESEGQGEVQEMIDICDFAVGLSRQLYGLTIATERPEHRMMETWQPLGVVGIITAFNFPVAVWSWNAAIALVCGDSIVWKASEKTPLSTMGAHAIFERALQRFAESGPAAPEGLSGVLYGGRELGEQLVGDTRAKLISATGSVPMGRAVGPRVARRFGRMLLELGGNNAAVVCPSADLDLALRGIAFAAMGTVGQRCTSLRRAFVHESVYDRLVPRLKVAYQSATLGNPLDPETLIGPLIDKRAFDCMQDALASAVSGGGVVTGGARALAEVHERAYYVHPAIVEMPEQRGIVYEETFAPILYVMKYSDFDDVIEKHNDVSQGLSSSIFTRDMREAETFVSARGSDCGIANVNIGPSGAEIGGAFGGEKETGGGRESGTDAWKAYMRRQTNTINYGNSLPLAQGVTFDVG